VSLLTNIQWLAALFLDRMLISVVGGTALVAAVSLLLYLVPKKNSQTRFAVWLATLLAVAVLPLLRVQWPSHHPQYVNGHPLITIPAAWATYLILFWAVIAIAGLLRVAVALWTLRRLRRNSTQVPIPLLDGELGAAITELREKRPVSLLVSPLVNVPGAIGFWRPAVVLPPWLAEDLSAIELKYVVLHELAHLRRWDDWTTLAQELVKALLFFHPGVWWIERKLFLDREMACDDAVLARAGSARVYAQCLARVAEKSFLRRQFALAQAAVDRMRQLSLRLAQILDEDRPRARGLWKPALPVVTAFALFFAFSASRAPELVRISDTPPMLAAAHSSPAVTESAGLAASAFGRQVEMPASQRTAPSANAGVKSFIPALFTLPQGGERKANLLSVKRGSHPRGDRVVTPRLAASSVSIQEAPTTVTQSDGPDSGGLVVVLLTDRIVTSDQVGEAGSTVVQIKVLELRWIVPAERPTKLIPRKT